MTKILLIIGVLPIAVVLWKVLGTKFDNVVDILIAIAAPIIAWFLYCAFHLWMYPEEYARVEGKPRINPKKKKQ